MSAAWRRFNVTRLVLQQRQRLCEELAARGLQMHSLIVADDENLDIAVEHGCVTLEMPNKPLGQKCNAGLHRAAELADWVVWVGSDDWIHPDVFEPLIGWETRVEGTILHGGRVALVNLKTGRLQRVSSPSKYGAIPWLIESRLIRPERVDPIRSHLSYGLDGSLIRGLRLGRIPFGWEFHDPHPFRCVDFKSSENITPYKSLAKHLGQGEEASDPWPLLAEFYPGDLVAQAERLSHDIREGVPA